MFCGKTVANEPDRLNVNRVLRVWFDCQPEQANGLDNAMVIYPVGSPDVLADLPTKEQFKTFLEQTAAAEYGRRLLEEMSAQNAARAAAAGAGTAAQGNTHPIAKAAHTPQEGGAGGDAAQG